MSLLFSSLFFVKFDTETQYGFYPLVMFWNEYKNSYTWPYGFSNGNNFKYVHVQSHLEYLYSYSPTHSFVIQNSNSFVTVTSQYGMYFINKIP